MSVPMYQQQRAREVGNTFWPIGADLLAQRNVHAQVQPGVDLPIIGREVIVEGLGATRKQVLVFGVFPDDIGDQIFQWL